MKPTRVKVSTFLYLHMWKKWVHDRLRHPGKKVAPNRNSWNFYSQLSGVSQAERFSHIKQSYLDVSPHILLYFPLCYIYSHRQKLVVDDAQKRTQDLVVQTRPRCYRFFVACVMTLANMCKRIFVLFWDLGERFHSLDIHLSSLLYKIKTNLPRYFLLFKSYLYNRRFYVRHGYDISESQPIKSGVLQGSVLGTVLYTLYIADLPIRR